MWGVIPLVFVRRGKVVCVLGSPGPPLGLMTCWENSKDSAYSHNWIKIYYSKRTQSEFSKRKRDTGWSLRVLGTSLGKSPFRVLYKMPFIPPAMSYDNTGKQLSFWKAHPSLGAKIFLLGAGLLRYHLPGRHGNFRPPERKQESAINYIAYTKNLDLVSPSY